MNIYIIWVWGKIFKEAHQMQKPCRKDWLFEYLSENNSKLQKYKFDK